MTEKEVLTEKERIELKHKGGSNFLRLPAAWLQSIPQLTKTMVFDATVQREDGKIMIVFEKVTDHARQSSQ